MFLDLVSICGAAMRCSEVFFQGFDVVIFQYTRPESTGAEPADELGAVVLKDQWHMMGLYMFREEVTVSTLPSRRLLCLIYSI